MPLRAFIDSDHWLQGESGNGETVLMPLRAFIDSDSGSVALPVTNQIRLNALTGIY
mgnify:CR=1 FL=1